MCVCVIYVVCTGRPVAARTASVYGGSSECGLGLGLGLGHRCMEGALSVG